jgi:hypothetical protein
MVRAFLSASFIAWGYFITGALAAATGSAFLFFGGRPIQRGICSALSGTSDNSRAQEECRGRSVSNQSTSGSHLTGHLNNSLLINKRHTYVLLVTKFQLFRYKIPLQGERLEPAFLNQVWELHVGVRNIHSTTVHHYYFCLILKAPT